MTIHEAANEMDLAEAQQKLLDSHHRLLQLQQEGRDDTPESDQLRDEMDVYWLCLNYKSAEGGNGFMARMLNDSKRD